MKKYVLIGLLFSLGFTLQAQQITRFAVVDLSRVYTTFFRDSRAVREFEEQGAKVQTEINRMTAEIQELRSNQVNAEARGDREQALRIQNDVYRKSEFLKEYYQVKTAELEDKKNKLTQSSSFLEQVNDEVRYIAESEGYSLVLKKDNPGILWYTATVDITDKVIQNLRAKAGR